MSAETRQARLAAATTELPAAANDLPRRVTQRGALSRDRIIDAALELLAEGGYAALSISAICKRSGVSAASLYHHFGDKAGLLTAMIEESMRATARRFVEAASAQDRLLERVQAFFDVTREIGRDRRNDAIAVLLTLADARFDAPKIALAIADARARAWRLAAAEFNDAFAVEDGMFFTHLQFAFASYITHVRQSSSDKTDMRAMFRSYQRLMIIALAAMRPELAHDPAFAAALAEASRQRPALPDAALQEKTDDGREP